MKINEITEVHNFDDYKYKRSLSVGQEMFSFHPSRGNAPSELAIVPVIIAQRRFMGKDYKVEWAGSPPHSGNGGIWAADLEELFDTREEAEKAMFMNKLKGIE